MSGQHLRLIGGVGLAVIATTFAAVRTDAATPPYIYTGGPNTVDLSGSRCRSTFDYYPDVQYTAGSVRAGSAAATLYCPVPRRSTAYYGNVTANNPSYPIDTTLSVASVTMTAADGTTTGGVSCRPFAALVGGSKVYGLNRYLCATAGGCSSAPASSWQGTNTMFWVNPFTNLQVINWGISCYAPPNSGVNQYEVVVTPDT